MFHDISSPSGNREQKISSWIHWELITIYLHAYLALSSSLQELYKSVSDQNAPTKYVPNAICIMLFWSFKCQTVADVAGHSDMAYFTSSFKKNA